MQTAQDRLFVRLSFVAPHRFLTTDSWFSVVPFVAPCPHDRWPNLAVLDKVLSSDKASERLRTCGRNRVVEWSGSAGGAGRDGARSRAVVSARYQTSGLFAIIGGNIEANIPLAAPAPFPGTHTVLHRRTGRRPRVSWLRVSALLPV